MTVQISRILCKSESDGESLKRFSHNSRNLKYGNLCPGTSNNSAKVCDLQNKVSSYKTLKSVSYETVSLHKQVSHNECFRVVTFRGLPDQRDVMKNARMCMRYRNPFVTYLHFMM